MIVVVITRSVFERTTQRGGIVFATLDNRHALHPRFEHHRFKPPLCVSPSLSTHSCPIHQRGEGAVCLGAKLVQELHAALGEDGGQGTVLQPLEAGSEGRLKVENI